MKKINIIDFKLLMSIFFLVLLSSTLYPIAILIPVDEHYPPLDIKYQRVDVKITDKVATTKVEQVFINKVNRPIEATYIFPVPKGASVTDFYIYINGQKTSGELIEKEKARKIYEDIVRKMRDPGLLEYLGDDLFKARVYPIPANGEQKIEIGFSQILSYDSGLCKYTYPLKTPLQYRKLLEDFTMQIEITSQDGIKNVYSPSHKIGITRKGDKKAIIGFEEESADLSKDFELFYSLSKADMGISVLSYREKGEDGYALILISPNVEVKETQIIAKDVIFVIDTSGSMAKDNKIEQVKDALEYCIKNLNDKDRFNIVRFSTDVELFRAKFLEHSSNNVEEAVRFIKNMRATGGTNINEALQDAIAFTEQAQNQCTIVFLTDGKPTVGITDINSIIDNIKAENKKVRIFTFGAGYDVNTHLLDKISEITQSYSEYIKPEEDIEVKVSSFFDKINYPVLTNLSFTTSMVKLYDVYPKEMPDLFKGSQVSILARYKEFGEILIELKGKVGREEKKYEYEIEFPKVSSENDFIAKLWANRKVGYLLDAIRLNGEEKELVDEIVALSKEFGIVTPYTSYLILEDESVYERMNVTQNQGRVMRERYYSFAVPEGQRAPEAMRELSAVPLSQASPVPQAGSYMTTQAGKSAVDLSVGIKDLKKTDVDKATITRVIKVKDKTFEYRNEKWIDSKYKEGMKILKIGYMSDAYFTLLDLKPEIKSYLELGNNLIIEIDGKAIEIGDFGDKAKTTKEELIEFIGLKK